MLHSITNAAAAAPREREAMVRRKPGCDDDNRRKLGPWRGRRRQLRLLAGAAGVRLGLLPRLRVRLSGVLGLLLRRMDELRCRPGRRAAACRWSPASAPAAHCPHGRRHQRDQSSFYAEAIADCLEFIKSRSSYCPAKDDRV